MSIAKLGRRKIIIVGFTLLFFCFLITQSCASLGNSQGGRSTYGGGNNQQGSGYHSNGPFGNTGSDGSCTYYFDSETGASVMTGDC